MSDTSSEILARMEARLTNPASKMPGSFTRDNLGAVSNELGRVYSEKRDELIARAHVSSARIWMRLPWKIIGCRGKKPPMKK